MACPVGGNATPACTAGVCELSCTEGFGDCNGAASDGCELNLTSDKLNCKTCGNVCGVGKACVASTCVIPTPIALSTGRAHSCAIFNDGSVKCWGSNGFGELGVGDTNDRGYKLDDMGDKLPVVDLGAGKTTKAMALGSYHTCALLNDDSVKCWGYNIDGQLGLGDMLERGGQPSDMGDNLPAVDLGAGKTAKAIAAGGSHTCALLNDDSIKCWGYNGNGQLGLGDDDDRGDGPNEMGDKLLAVDLGAGKLPKSIAAGGDQTCAIVTGDSIKCWGDNSYGQLGLGDNDSRGDLPNQMGDVLAAVSLGEKKTVVVVEVGGDHSCALLNDKTVKCWGYNANGRLGIGDGLNRGDNTNELGDFLPAVEFGTGKTAKGLTVGNEHSCALLNDDTIKCWGDNGVGQLGLGDTMPRGGSSGQMGDMLPAVNLGAASAAKAIHNGAEHTCALLATGAVKCWGWNGNGQLGLGDTANRGDNSNEMGNMLPALSLTGM